MSKQRKSDSEPGAGIQPLLTFAGRPTSPLAFVSKTRSWTPAFARKMKPTQKHRVALSQGILGTLYAHRPDGVRTYHDYRWQEALNEAVVLEHGSDARVWDGKLWVLR